MTLRVSDCYEPTENTETVEGKVFTESGVLSHARLLWSMREKQFGASLARDVTSSSNDEGTFQHRGGYATMKQIPSELSRFFSLESFPD